MSKKKKPFDFGGVGHCPHCNSQNIEYEPRPNYMDNLQLWGFECNDCGTIAVEESTIEYVSTNVDDEEPLYEGDKVGDDNDE